MAKKKTPVSKGPVSRTIPEGHIIIYAGPLKKREDFKENLADAKRNYDSVNTMTEEDSYFITGKPRKKR